MSDDKSLDLVGVGKLAEAIPDTAWNKLVDTACETFRSCIAPVTETTSGVGRLIEARFNRLVDVEKVLASETVAKAKRKAEASKRTSKRSLQAPVVIQCIEQSAAQTDATLRELWANLLAQELSGGEVHPEFVSILSRISSQDAALLEKISGRQHLGLAAALRQALIENAPFRLVLGIPNSGFAHEHLRNLHLIFWESPDWYLTKVGRAFIKAVSDPAFEETSPATQEAQD